MSTACVVEKEKLDSLWSDEKKRPADFNTSGTVKMNPKRIFSSRDR